MSKQVYINLPVADVAKSTEFYTALGFTKNADWSNVDASCMVFSETIYFMLLSHEFYSKFTSKVVPDLTQTSSVLISLSFDSKEEVQKFADIAKELGGSYFVAEPNKELDFIYCLEVTDLDGHTIEPTFMDMTKIPTN